jgi:hypothetical protein
MDYMPIFLREIKKADKGEGVGEGTLQNIVGGNHIPSSWQEMIDRAYKQQLVYTWGEGMYKRWGLTEKANKALLNPLEKSMNEHPLISTIIVVILTALATIYFPSVYLSNTTTINGGIRIYNNTTVGEVSISNTTFGSNTTIIGTQIINQQIQAITAEDITRNVGFVSMINNANFTFYNISTYTPDNQFVLVREIGPYGIKTYAACTLDNSTCIVFPEFR